MNWAARALAEQERFYGGMTQWMKIHWEEAAFVEMQPYYERPETYRLEIGGHETAEVPVGKDAIRCLQYEAGPAQRGHSNRRSWIQCSRAAGQGTDHEGVGLCYMHDGWRGRGLAQGAILMAMAYGDELNVTPWQALLQQVRSLANQVAYCQQKVIEGEAEHGAESLLPGGKTYEWVTMLESRGDRLAKVSKMTIDAGVAKMMAYQLDLEAKIMYQSANAALDSIPGMTQATRERALEIMASTARQLEASAMDQDVMV